MRIALFTNNYLPFCGGVTISVETLRRGLEASGHEAWVFAPAPDRGRGRAASGRSLPVDPGRDLSGVRAGGAVCRAASSGSCRRSRSTSSTRTIRSCSARRRGASPGDPTAADLHLSHALREVRALRAAAARARAGGGRCGSPPASPAQADAVLAPSAVIRDELHARGVRTPIAVVPTGVDLERFRPGDREAARRSLGVGQGEPLVLYVGRLDREKSVDRVLGAFERVASTHPGRPASFWWGRAPRRSGCGARPRAPAGGRADPLSRTQRRTIRWPSATRPPTSFCSPPRPRRRAWSSPKPPRAACRRWPSTPRAATRSFATATPESSRRAIRPRWPKPRSDSCSIAERRRAMARARARCAERLVRRQAPDRPDDGRLRRRGRADLR